MGLKRIAIFASGTGSNALAILNYGKNHGAFEVAMVVTNRATAGVLEHANRFGVKAEIISKGELKDSAHTDKLFQSIDLIVLAGFLWLIPKHLVQAHRIVNIHPSLLPKHGGKGMFGMNVHKAVVEAKDSKSGITIHHVNEVFDKGKPIFQKSCSLKKSDAPEEVAKKVLKLEHAYYPRIIDLILNA